MTLVEWIVQSTLLAAGLALAVAALCRTRRFVPAVRHALWLLVLVKLVTPPVVALPFPWAGWFDAVLAEPSNESRPAPASGPSASRRVAERDESRPIRSIEIDLTGPGAEEWFAPFTEGPADQSDFAAAIEGQGRHPAFVALDEPAAAESPGVSHAAPPNVSGHLADSILRTLACGWAIGTAWVVLIQGKRLWRLSRLIASGTVPAGDLAAIVASAAAEFGVRAPDVRIVSGLRSPALCAWGRATLLWPEERLACLSPAARRAIVLHELAHLRRRDHWVGWLELIAGCGWWWNPLFWYVRHQLHENAELACDAWVVALEPDGRRAYAEALIDVAQSPMVPQLSGIVLGAGDGSRKLLERRLVMIMREKVRYRIPLAGLVAIPLIGLATLPSWSTGDESPKPLDPLVADGAAAPLPAILPGNPPTASPAPAAPSALPVPTAPPAPTASQAELPLPTPALAPVFDETVGPPTALPAIAAEGPSAGVIPPTSAIPAVAPTPSARPLSRTEAVAPTDESRLQRVQAQLEAMLAEVKSLRGRPAAPSMKLAEPAPVYTTIAPPSDPGRPSARQLEYKLKRDADLFERAAKSIPAPAARKPVGPHTVRSDSPVPHTLAAPVDDGADRPETETVIRTTYKLPPGKAESLAKFLRDQLSDDVEIKVKAESLQVTAAEEDQAAVQHLIRLLLRRARPAARERPATSDAGIPRIPDSDDPFGPPGAVNAIPAAAPSTFSVKPGRFVDEENLTRPSPAPAIAPRY